MGRGSRGGSSHPARRTVDLTGHISTAEKNSLATLVNAITDKMQEGIGDIFDSPSVSPALGECGFHSWLSLPLIYRAENKENNPPSTSASKNQAVSLTTPLPDHIIAEEEEKETMAPQLCELKKEALVSFCKWQASLLQKIRDIDIKDQQPTHWSPRGRGRGALRGGFRGNEVRGGRNGRGGLMSPAGNPTNPTHHADVALSRNYPPIPNNLWTLPHERRKLLFHLVLLVALSLSEYSANTYVLLVNLTSSLNLPLSFLRSEERKLAQAMAQAALDVSPEELLSQKAEDAKVSRRSKAHGIVIHTSLAPALAAAGIGTPQGSYGLTNSAAAGLLGPLADGGRAMCNLFGMNPAKPTTKMMEVFGREIQDFALLPVQGETLDAYVDARQRLASERRFRLVLAIGGWMSEDSDVTKPWQTLGRETENYAMRWDPGALLSLGSSLETVIKSSAWSRAKREISKRTIFTSLIESEWPLPLLKISKIMDNPWSVGMVRAEKAGTVLADAVMRHKFQGDRAVSLVGYSLGGRAIYTCLMVLAERRCFGLVESVVIMGAPIPSESRVWITLKSVVSGRLINVYSEHDYLLGFLCRFSNTQFGVAGLQQIHGARGVESHNVGEIPRGHLGYESAAGQILKDIGWDKPGREAAP